VKRLVVLGLLAACGPKTVDPPPGPPPAKNLQLNQPGEMVRVELHPGYVTVIDFWSETCGACEVATAKLESTTVDADRVLIRKVDVGDGFTPVAEAYGVGALPHLNVYDKTGKLRYKLVGNESMTAGDKAKELMAEP
jgi:thiol-disulfide isomerase/thioredoxin